MFDVFAHLAALCGSSSVMALIYVFTDISASFLDTTKELSAGFTDTHSYHTLDHTLDHTLRIADDLTTQGFLPWSYDIAIVPKSSMRHSSLHLESSTSLRYFVLVASSPYPIHQYGAVAQDGVVSENLAVATALKKDRFNANTILEFLTHLNYVVDDAPITTMKMRMKTSRNSRCSFQKAQLSLG